MDTVTTVPIHLNRAAGGLHADAILLRANGHHAEADALQAYSDELESEAYRVRIGGKPNPHWSLGRDFAPQLDRDAIMLTGSGLRVEPRPAVIACRPPSLWARVRRWMWRAWA